MAILTRTRIVEAIKRKKLKFEPGLDEFQLQPHAIDLRLGNVFKLPKTWAITERGRESLNIDYLNPANPDFFEEIILKPGQFFDLLPQEFIIVATMEKISLNSGNLMGVLYPRTSINRRGLSVNLSGIIDVGYSGQLIVPILNNTLRQTIRLYPGERFCQMVLHELTERIALSERQQHGLSAPKYTQTDQHNNHARADSVTEIDLIKQGDIKTLKQKFSLS